MGEFDKAWKDYEQLQWWIPDNLSVRLGIAMLYQKEKRYDECFMVLSGMIEEFPEIAELYIARSNLERERGHNELAMIDLEKAIEIDPDNANNYILQAIIYEKMGKKDAARKCREKATLLGADSSVTTF
jgi:tetratricopeptide (TPR) repeat protein